METLDGFFSGIIFDTNQNRIFAFCDHIASEEVIYGSFDDLTVISSDLKDILNRLQKKNLNTKRIESFFRTVHPKDNETFFNDIDRLGAGEILSLKDEEKTISNYHNFNLDKYNNLKDESDYAALHKELFEYAVDGCMDVNDQKIGTALSGGLDSSSITSIACEKERKEITGFTAIFSKLKGSDLEKTYELNYAQTVAEKYNLNHVVVDIVNAGAISYLNQNIQEHYEPDLLVNGYIHENIFKHVSKMGLKYYIDGYGGDSVISHGYNHLHELGTKLDVYNLFLEANKLYKSHGKRMPKSKIIKEYIVYNLMPDYLHWIIKCNSKNPPKQKIWSQRISKAFKKQSTYKNLKNVYNDYPLKLKNSAKYQHSREVISPIISLSVQTVKSLARKYGVEIRFPFLSKKLMELSINTPVKFKLKDGVNRSIFRKSMEGILPNEILKRISKSDLSPLSQNEVSKICFDEVRSLILKRCPSLFNENFLYKMFKNPKKYIFEIYQVYSFLKWLDYNDFNT